MSTVDRTTVLQTDGPPGMTYVVSLALVVVEVKYHIVEQVVRK